MRTLDEFRGAEKGKIALVCGTGPSMALLNGRTVRDDVVTFGCNRMFEWPDVRLDYHVLVDRPAMFKGILDEILAVKFEKARLVGYSYEKWIDLDPDAVAFTPFGVVAWDRPLMNGKVFDDMPAGVPCYYSSPFAMACLAAFMGCTGVYLLGADYVTHPDMAVPAQLAKILEGWHQIEPWLRLRGCPLHRLAEQSVLPFDLAPLDTVSQPG